MQDSPTNGLLLALPQSLRDRILAVAELVELPNRTVLYSPAKAPRFIHFVTSGIISVVNSMQSGDSAETGLIGREGIPEGLFFLWPAPALSACFVQIPASALRVDLHRFETEFFPDEAVRRAIFRYIQYTALLTSQIAACNGLHAVEQRLARWLLMVADRVGEPRYFLTQEFLAEMLGSRRVTVTVTASALKRNGLITYRRGHLEIIDRAGLEAAACECYRITRRLLDELKA